MFYKMRCKVYFTQKLSKYVSKVENTESEYDRFEASTI
jgi:hypothetical protein